MPFGEIPVALAWAHPLVAEWFLGRFGSPTEPQEQGWPEILAGRTTLISAPTGSGKTLAAFLICIDRLVRKALEGALHNRTEVLYVSPLKALGNDIQKNLDGPLSEILALAAERGLLMPEIRTAVRTGDTLMKERRDMLKRPPHILVTTPESLYILLTANGSRAILHDVETVIVDEIHAVADDKRGAHLTLSLERLDLLANRPTRIGLSATQKPIEEIAHFLTGAGRPAPAVVNIGHRRKLDLAVEVPPSELGPVASNEMWGEIYDRIAELALQHRSTLVFVNTRRLAERVALHLGERIGEELVAAHHGSLAQAAPQRRAQTEERRNSPAGGDGFAGTWNRYRHRGRRRRPSRHTISIPARRMSSALSRLIPPSTSMGTVRPLARIQSPELADLVAAGRNEGLAAPAGIDRHDQDVIEIVQDLLEGPDGRRRIEAARPCGRGPTQVRSLWR